MMDVLLFFKVIHTRPEKMSEADFQVALEKAKQRILHAATNNVPSNINQDGKEENNEAQNMANRFARMARPTSASLLLREWIHQIMLQNRRYVSLSLTVL